MRKSYIYVTLLIIILAISAFVLKSVLFAKREAIESISAAVSGAPLEIRANMSGKIMHIAKNGDRIKKGELLLKIDTTELLAQTDALEAELKSLSASLTPDQSRILGAYRHLPGSLQDLEQSLAEAQKEEEQATESVNEASTAHSTILVKMRALELKTGMTTAEAQTLREYYVEENLLATALGNARNTKEKASERRAELENELLQRKKLEQAFNALPTQQKEIVKNISSILDQLHSTESKIAASALPSPINARVIAQMIQPGTQTDQGELALVLLPEVSDALCVTAFFDPEKLQDIPSGTPCSVTIDSDPPLTLGGTLLERIPYVAQSDQEGAPYKVRLALQNTDNLLRLRQEQTATVRILPEAK